MAAHAFMRFALQPTPERKEENMTAEAAKVRFPHYAGEIDKAVAEIAGGGAAD